MALGIPISEIPVQEQYTGVNKVLDDWGQRITAAIKNALPRNKDVSGQLRNSISFTFTKFGMPITFQVIIDATDVNGVYYWDYVNSGIGLAAGHSQGKPPPWNVVRSWIINKQLTLDQHPRLHGSMPKKGMKVRFSNKKSLISDNERALRTATFFIRRKIGRYGIAPTPFVSDTITDAEIQLLQTELSAAFKQDIIVNINKSFGIA